jgi:hypothetical protein
MVAFQLFLHTACGQTLHCERSPFVERSAFARPHQLHVGRKLSFLAERFFKFIFIKVFV